MNEIISFDEFSNSPLYKDMKIGDIIHIECNTIGKKPYRYAECYPHEVTNIQIKNSVRIEYKRINNE